MTEDKGNMTEEMIQTFRMIEEEAGKTLRVDDFLAIISHEFRNPMNAAINYLHLLLMGEYGALTDEQAKFLKRATTEVESLLDLVNVSFDLVDPDKGGQRIKFREVIIPALLEELEAETQFLCKEASLVFQCTVQPGVSSIWTDPLRLKMVLRNLLLNAIKYTERGRIVLKVYPKEEGVGFCVSDTGVGIPEEALPRIFHPFYRVEDSQTRWHGEGSGFGLYVVKRLVELLGGNIEVESKLERGSTFHVWVPSRKQ